MSIRLDFGRDEFGDFFFMGGSEEEFRFFAILEFVQFGSNESVPVGNVVEGGGEESGERETSA